MDMIVIDKRLCDTCKLCLAACRYGALAIENGQIIHIASVDCEDCRTCEFICARGAISYRYEVVLAEAETTG